MEVDLPLAHLFQLDSIRDSANNELRDSQSSFRIVLLTREELLIFDRTGNLSSVREE